MLERQTFPVLLIFGLDDADIEPRLRWKAGRIEVLEPHLVLIQSIRWLPLEERTERLSETERLSWSRELLEVQDELREAGDPAVPEGTRRLVEARLRVLRYQALGSRMSQPLPVDLIFASREKPLALPQPRDITPSEITLSRGADGRVTPAQARLAITGTGFEAVDLSRIELAQGSATVRKAELLGGAILVEVEVRSAKAGAVVFRLPVRLGASGAEAASVLSPPVMVSVR